MQAKWLVPLAPVLLMAALSASLGASDTKSTSVSPPSGDKLKIVGQIGGPTRAVAVQGKYAYVGVGLRLTILDVSDPAKLMEWGSTEPFEWYVEEIAVARNVAYVAAGGAGLYAVDVSDPGLPKILGHYDSLGYAEGVVVAGKHAYLADGPDGLRIVDISDPKNLREISAVYDLNYAFDVALQGDYAYIAAAGAGMLVAQVTDPVKPVAVGNLDTPGYAYGVAVSGGTAYIADGWEGLQVVDVTTPVKPKLAGNCDTYGWAMDVVVAKARVYVAAAAGGLRVFDASEPANLSDRGYFAVPNSHVQNVAVSGNTVYAADIRQGIHVIDISAPAKSKRMGLYSPMGWAQAVEVAGGYAYVAAQNYGLRIIDLADYTHPREAGVFRTQKPAVTVALSDSAAYIGTFFEFPSGSPPDLYTVDVSDPLHPKGFPPRPLTAHRTGVTFVDQSGLTPDVPNNVSRALLVHEKLLCNAGEWGLLLWDISKPLAPRELSFLQVTLDTGAQEGNPCTTAAAISGNIAFLANQGGGLYAVDISKPDNPVLLGVFVEPAAIDGKEAPKPMCVNDVEAAGKYAYIFDNDLLRVIDASDPQHLKSVSVLRLPMVSPGNGMVGARSLAIDGDQLFVADGSAGLLLVDVSNPSKPILSERVILPGFASWVSLDRQFVYVAAGEGGLYVIKRGGESASTIIPGAKQSDGAAQKLPLSISASPDSNSLEQYHPVSLKKVASSNIASTDLPGFKAGKTITVTSTADSSPGTLRQCIERAKSGDRIIFDAKIFPIENPATVFLKDGLTLGQGGVIIDGSNAGVILDGSKTPACTTGICIKSDNNIIMGLQILYFSNCGIDLYGSNNVIGGNITRGKGRFGEGNVLSGNGWAGLRCGKNATGNRVCGNLIGTDAHGENGLGAQPRGINLYGSTGNITGNIIGGMAAEERNIISGNLSSNLSLMSAFGNMIVGNYIGTDVTGQRRLGRPTYFDVTLECGSASNKIKDNVIAGSLLTSDTGSSYNEIVGNHIGVDVTGTVTFEGVARVIISLPFNRVGGTGREEGNLIAGTINISTSDTVVVNNLINTDLKGKNIFGNNEWRVNLMSGSCHNFIGGATVSERNVINSGNGDGVHLGPMSQYNFVAGNYIGTGPGGAITLPNGVCVALENAEHNFIQTNLIAGATDYGVRLDRSNCNLIRGNRITQSGMGIGLWMAEHNIVQSNNLAAASVDGD